MAIGTKPARGMGAPSHGRGERKTKTVSDRDTAGGRTRKGTGGGDEPVLVKRLRERLRELDISQLEATRRMNVAARDLSMDPVNDTFLRDVLNGKKRTIGSDRLVILARALGRNPNWFLGVDNASAPGAREDTFPASSRGSAPPLGVGAEWGVVEVIIVGRIETGRWIDPSTEPLKTSASKAQNGVVRIAPVAGYEPDHLAAFAIGDRSADLVCPPGSTAIIAIIGPKEAADAREGDYVLAERRREGLVERSIRRIARDGARWVLTSPSSDAALARDVWPLAGPSGARIVGYLAASQIAIPRRAKVGD